MTRIRRMQLAFGVAAIVAAGGVRPAAGDPLREARLLLDGRVRPGAWTAVGAAVGDAGSPREAWLGVRAGPVEFRARVSLPAEGVRRVRIPLYIPPGGALPVPALDGTPAPEAVQTALQRSIVEVRPEDLLIGVDPATAGFAPPRMETLEGGRVVHWVGLTLDELRDAPEALDALDGLVCGPPAPEQEGPLHALDAPLGVWLGRGGRVFADPGEARRAAAGGWQAPLHAADVDGSAAEDIAPRTATSPRRLEQGRTALALVLALGTAAMVLAGWRGLPRRGPAVAVTAAAAAGLGVAYAVVPARQLIARGAVVRETMTVERRAWEADEGVLVLESRGALDTQVRFPPRVRVCVAAPPAVASGDGPVEIMPAADGWSVRLRLPECGRIALRLSRRRPAGGTVRARRLPMPQGETRIDYDSGLDGELTDAVVVVNGAAARLGTIPGEAAGQAVVTPGRLDWSGVLRVWPPGDPRRAAREWWGRRMRGGAWLVANCRSAGAEVPFDVKAGVETDAEWAPTLLVVRVED